MKRLLLASILILIMATGTFAVNYETITVQQGQDINAIARANLKDTSMWRELLEFNGITHPSQIRAGVELRVPYSISINRVARISSKVGTVQLNESSRWTDTYVNQILVQDSTLRTGASSRVIVELDDGTVLRVGPNTQIELSGYNYNNGARNTDVDLTAGSVALRVTRLSGDSSFSVSSVTAVAGVRGTSFFMEVDEEEDVDIAVYQGAVGITSSRTIQATPEGQEANPDVVVQGGYATTISSLGDIETPYEIPGRIEWID
jgi:hypothetical protein